MKNLIVLNCLLFTVSCSSFDETYERLKTKPPVVDKSAEVEKARIQEFLNHRNLRNTINLKIGQTKKEVLDILLEPSSVSASGSETTWQYSLSQYPSMEAAIFPFKVVFSGEKVSRFGVDQDQIERDKARVIIQKDFTGEKEKGN